MSIRHNPRAFSRGFSLLVLVLLSGCSRSTGDSHLVGHLAPRSGPDQGAGLRASEAVALAADAVNVSEETHIDRRPVTIVHGDTGTDADAFAFQATRLLRVNRVSALIGATTTAQLEKLAPVAQSDEVVVVSPSGGLPGSQNRFVFAVGLDPKERGRVLARFAAEELKLADVLVVSDDSRPPFSTIAEAFQREFKHADRKLRQPWTFRSRSELPDLAARITRDKPAAVLFCGTARDVLALRREPLPEKTVLLLGGEEDEAVLSRDPERSQDIYFTTAFSPEDSSAKVQEFATQFRNRTKQAPDVDAALSNDAANILFTAARRAKTFKTTKDLREELMPQAEFDCLTGPFSFTPEQTARRIVYVAHMRNGSAKMIKPFPPEKK